MPFSPVMPILDYSVRELCPKRYPGHPHGCPNYGKRPSCPPASPFLGEVLDMSEPIWCVWNVFAFEAHVERMRTRHPEWSPRQLACCLYWQGTARKALAAELKVFVWEVIHVVQQGYTLADYQDHTGLGFTVVVCPEACGVNVTATMKTLGIELEWPPKTVAYQVALVGVPKG